MDFNQYFDNQQLETALKEFVAQYPNLAQFSELGRSHEDRPIWLLTLTNQQTGPDTDKPGVWIDANIHATEITGTTTSLRIAHALLSGYGSEERPTRLLDQAVYYIVPRLNPDGAALGMAANPRYIRSGVRPYPFAEMQEGLHSQDIDGDGRILQMRIPDSNGEWKVSSMDARLLEKRAPDEHGGQYYRLFNEGLLEDYDGYLIKASRPYQGLDFNRNFPSQWRPENEQTGAGPFPGSEPEIRAAIAFITSHPNINIALTYHTFSRVILRPYGTKPDDEMPTNDLWVFKKMGEIGTSLTGYRNVSTFHDFKYHPKEVITGVFDDWMYDTLGIFSFTVEQWDLPTEAGIEERKFMDWFRVHPHEEDLQILKWCDEHVGKDGYVEWYPFDHPQLGKVELGGWNFMYTWRNPPHSLIGAEAERNLPFALALGDMLPRLSLHTLEAKSLGNGETYLNLVVENIGFLPTCTSEQGRSRKAGRTVRVELHLPEGVQLLSGRRKVDLEHLAGRSGRLEAAMIWTSSPTDNRARSEWVLAGPSGAQIGVSVLSDRAGSLYTSITLP